MYFTFDFLHRNFEIVHYSRKLTRIFNVEVHSDVFVLEYFDFHTFTLDLRDKINAQLNVIVLFQQLSMSMNYLRKIIVFFIEIVSFLHHYFT